MWVYLFIISKVAKVGFTVQAIVFWWSTIFINSSLRESQISWLFLGVFTFL